MASQSGTRYEDRTMQRGAAGGGAIAAHMNNSAAGYMVRFVNKQLVSHKKNSTEINLHQPPLRIMIL